MSDYDATTKFDALMSLFAMLPGRDTAAVQAVVELMETASAMARCLEDRFFKGAISEGRFTVLALLFDAPHGGMTPSELASGAGVTRATMTGLLDGLEREGHVMRQKFAGDRRKLTVQLTQAGQQFLMDVLPNLYELMDSIGEALPVSRRDIMTTLLTRMRQAIA
jgi:DNA-binding MarR family transcriptional regulator